MYSATSLNCFSSSSLKRSKIGESISNTATTSLFLIIGRTISLLLALSQAICPLNLWTSATRWIFLSSTHVPQTPFPNGIRIQAGFPWKGPKTNSPSLTM